MSKHKSDSNGGRKYFGTIPHMAGAKLDVYEHRLYSHYVEICGVSRTDECFQAEKTIYTACNMSKQRFLKARQALIDKDFITLRPGKPNKKGLKGYSALTTIIDIWAENIDFCQKRSYTGNILPVEGVNNYPLKGSYITPNKNTKNIKEKKHCSPEKQGCENDALDLEAAKCALLMEWDDYIDGETIAAIVNTKSTWESNSGDLYCSNDNCQHKITDVFYHDGNMDYVVCAECWLQINDVVKEPLFRCKGCHKMVLNIPTNFVELSLCADCSENTALDKCIMNNFQYKHLDVCGYTRDERVFPGCAKCAYVDGDIKCAVCQTTEVDAVDDDNVLWITDNQVTTCRVCNSWLSWLRRESIDAPKMTMQEADAAIFGTREETAPPAPPVKKKAAKNTKRTPEQKQADDNMFEAVKYVWKINDNAAWKIQKLKKFLLGAIGDSKADKRYGTAFKDCQLKEDAEAGIYPATAWEVVAFGHWYRNTYDDIAIPEKGHSLLNHLLSFRGSDKWQSFMRKAQTTIADKIPNIKLPGVVEEAQAEAEQEEIMILTDEQKQEMQDLMGSIGKGGVE